MAKLSKNSEMKEECTKKFCNKKYVLVIAGEQAVGADYQNQRLVIRLDQQIDDVFSHNVHVHYLNEREILLLSFVGFHFREKRENREEIPCPSAGKNARCADVSSP